LVKSLLGDVFSGRVRAGDHLTTQDLADRFGVSHTPVREALIALAGIGVIDLLPNRGAVVRRVTAAEVHEVCQVRRALECEATRSACGRIELAELHALADDLKRMMAVKPRPGTRFIEQARAIASRLHDLIADSCGNSFLAKELNRLKTLFRAFRDVSYTRDEPEQVARRLRIEIGEHTAIVDALLAGDRKAAGLAMSRHIQSAVAHWIRTLLEPGDEAHQLKENHRSA